MTIRVGIGYDAHRLILRRPLYLGGVKIPFPKGLKGHSDADVILHAISDALLGSAGLSDIGYYFPPSQKKWKNISSLIILKEVSRLIKKSKAKILNVDCVLLAESPRISPFIPEMKKKISSCLQISVASVGIRATTNEKMGFVGRSEGMSAYAVALVKK